jgi:hypothetical protein
LDANATADNPDVQKYGVQPVVVFQMPKNTTSNRYAQTSFYNTYASYKIKQIIHKSKINFTLLSLQHKKLFSNS